jgi:transcriptional regulator with XRE-family HTH domain
MTSACVIGGGTLDIGKKLKELRLQNDLTLEALASRCELTKGFLSQVERNLTSPSISTLKDILEALGTNLSEFFREEKEEQMVFTAQDFFVDEKEDYTIEWIVPNAQKNKMEPILLTLHPHCTSHELSSHQGQEFGYVLKGSVALLRGGKKIRVKAKETFYLDGAVSHCLYNPGNSDAVVLWITTPPMF